MQASKKGKQQQKPTGSRRTARSGFKASSSSNVGYAPVAASRSVNTRPIPSVSTNGMVTRVVHSEYFATVISTGTGFTVFSYSCNPGMASIFPWLSVIAQRYETYKFRDVCFHYHPRVPTSTAGTVGMVFDFDANDPAPTSQMEALSYHDKTADATWKEQKVRLDLAQGDRLPTRYTRVGLTNATQDLKTLDLGRLHVFVDGVAALTVGLLEVSYVVDLYTPQIQNPLGGALNGDTARRALDPTHLFGDQADDEALLPFSVSEDGGTITFDQVFEGIFSYRFVGTGLAGTITGTAGNLVFGDITRCIQGDSTVMVGYFKVRSIPGSTLSLRVTATTITTTLFGVSRAAYVAFG